MDKQRSVAVDTPINLIIIPKNESDPEHLSFKTLLERFYLLNTGPVTQGEA